MRKMLTVMALIALITPVLMDRVNAATLISNTLANINKIDVTNQNTINVVTVDVTDTKQLGGEALLTNLVATRTDNVTLIQKGKDAVLISHGAKGLSDKTLKLKGHLVPLSVSYMQDTRPLPATRGTPVDTSPTGRLLAGAIGGLRGSGNIVQRGGMNLLTTDATLNVPSDVLQTLSLVGQEGVTGGTLLSLGVGDGGVIGTVSTQLLTSV